MVAKVSLKAVKIFQMKCSKTDGNVSAVNCEILVAFCLV